tara:strand:+ start:1389 stop:3785 length:2397 start_codon:yes stop_codon:yes gene_type:complete
MIAVMLMLIATPFASFASASNTYASFEDYCSFEFNDDQGIAYTPNNIINYNPEYAIVEVEPGMYQLTFDCTGQVSSGDLEVAVEGRSQDGLTTKDPSTVVPVSTTTINMASTSVSVSIDATGAVGKIVRAFINIDAIDMNNNHIVLDGQIAVIPMIDTTNDTTPRISFWYGKVNQHNENGTWMTDSDGVSGGGTSAQWGSEGWADRKVEYCQKFWPNTVAVEMRDFVEFITFYTRGNSVAYDSYKPVYDCIQLEDNMTDDNIDVCNDSSDSVDGLIEISTDAFQYHSGDVISSEFEVCWTPKDTAMSLIAWLNNTNGQTIDRQVRSGTNNWGVHEGINTFSLDPSGGHRLFLAVAAGSTMNTWDYTADSLIPGEYCWEGLLKVYDTNNTLTFVPVDWDQTCFTVSNSTQSNNTGDNGTIGGDNGSIGNDNNTGDDNNTGSGNSTKIDNSTIPSCYTDDLGDSLVGGWISMQNVSDTYTEGDVIDWGWLYCWAPSNHSMSFTSELWSTEGAWIDLQGRSGGNWNPNGISIENGYMYQSWRANSWRANAAGWDGTVADLDIGEYCWSTQLKVYDGENFMEVDTETVCFTVSNSTQSNNTGDNGTIGGDNGSIGDDNNTNNDTTEEYASISVMINGIENSTVYSSMYIDELNIGNEYNLISRVTDYSGNGVYWTESYTWEATSWDQNLMFKIQGLADGTYCLKSELYVVNQNAPYATFVDEDEHCFVLGSNSIGSDSMVESNDSSHDEEAEVEEPSVIESLVEAIVDAIAEMIADIFSDSEKEEDSDVESEDVVSGMPVEE